MSSSGGMPSGTIFGIVFGVVGFVTSVGVRIFFYLRKEKREEKEREKAAQEKADLEKGKSENSSPTTEDSGLAAKPELEGTTVGAVMPKMELDSQPVVELPNIQPIRELDGSASVSELQANTGSTNAANNENGVVPAPPKQNNIAYELPG